MAPSPRRGVAAPGRIVLVYCPSDPEKFNLAFYSERGEWYDAAHCIPLRHFVTLWAEIPK